MSKESLTREIFEEEGLLSRVFSGYEDRPGQRAMAASVWESFISDENKLIEAGTGIGKSLAYLIPALLWAHEKRETVVISTYTIALQEQLIKKEIPVALKALDLDVNVAVAKGMGNYLCLKQLSAERLRIAGAGKLEEVSTWASTTEEGTRESIALAEDLWQSIKADNHTCHYSHCPHYRDCFFFKSRKTLEEAGVIIVNHHLLLADIQVRKARGEEAAILPFYKRLIIDEAHHLEPVATSSFSQRLDAREVLGALAHVHSDNYIETSRFRDLQQKLEDRISESLRQRLLIDLPGLKRAVQEILRAVTDNCLFFLGNKQAQRLTEDRADFDEEVRPSIERLIEEMKRYSSSLKALEDEVRELGKEPKLEPSLIDISKLGQKLEDWSLMLSDFLGESRLEEVRYIENQKGMPVLQLAKLQISEDLKTSLFDEVKSAVLCSATLAVDGSFDYVKKGLGLEAQGAAYPSPFDFENRALLLIPKDLPLPNQYDFQEKAIALTKQAIETSKGGAFLLFTSYEMLRAFKEEIEDLPYPIFEQGSLPRTELLQRFKEAGNGVLLGTDSFWEGVDVPGHALRLVILAKLPFPVPSDPINEARADLIKSEQRDPFSEDSVPRAAVKFRQGFGRLLRRKEDRGCILSLDSRLVTRGYGKKILASLPRCPFFTGTGRQVINKLEGFWSVAGSNR